MALEDLGFYYEIEKYRNENQLEAFKIGRVIAEHKERYIVKTEDQEFEAEITGNMRFTAKDREDFPAVGDWVALATYDSDFAIIHRIFPRYSVIKRQAVGHFGEIQIIATNIDYAFIMQAVDRDFNINRLERYITICNSSKVIPLILLTKIDLIDENRLSEILSLISSRIIDIQIISISNNSQQGFDKVNAVLQPRKTYCMLGSSGVGKSTLLNNLSGKSLMKTDSISSSNNKGRHITSHRELIVLESGALLIDNPGMREVGIADSSNGLEITFDRILELAENCKFKDCKHVNEIGCCVIDAVNNKEIDKSSYENFLKMEKEKEFFESSLAERKKKDKELGKIIKNYKKIVKHK